jgi:hypothetical protein
VNNGNARFVAVSHIMDRVGNRHLRIILAEEMIICYHPVCRDEALVLNNAMNFENHVEIALGSVSNYVKFSLNYLFWYFLFGRMLLLFISISIRLTLGAFHMVLPS